MVLIGKQTWDAYLCYLNAGGSIMNKTLTKGVRVVVKLVEEVQYQSGRGTKEEPYVLVEEN